MARPRKEIDCEQFEKLCGIQCTLSEIAGWFKCSEDTIENWCKRELGRGFSEVYKEYSASGKISLRRTQFRLAEKSYAMAIWLGKQYLGQRDRHEVTASAEGQLAALIDGLKEPVKDDIYTEATGVDGAMADEPSAKD